MRSTLLLVNSAIIFIFFLLTGANGQLYANQSVSQYGVGLIGVETDGLLNYAEYVLKVISDSSSILPGYSVNVLVTGPTNTSRAANELILKAIHLGAFGLVGPGNSSQTKLVAITSTDFNTSMISYYAGSNELSDKALYPFFFRTNPSYLHQGYAIADLVHYFSWSSVFVIADNSEFGLQLVDSFVIRSNALGFSILEIFFIPTSVTNYDDALLEARNLGSRIIVVLAGPTLLKGVLRAADRFNMIGFPYVYVGSNLVDDSIYNVDTDPEEKEQDFGRLISGLITIGDRAVTDYKENKFLAGYPGIETLPLRFQYLTNAIYAVSLALNDLLQKEKLLPPEVDGIAMKRVLSALSFEDVIWPNDPPVRFTALGDKVNPRFTVYNFNDTARSIVGSWVNGTIEITEPILWPENFPKNKIPDSTPRGTILYFNCPDGKSRNDTRGIVYYDSVDGDPTNIEAESYCDGIVDCNNFSDEDFSCDPSLPIGYILTAIIAIFGFIYLLFCLLLILVFRKTARIRAVGFIFLVISCLSCVAGIAAIFTYVGKPNTSICILRAWILCIPSGLLIGSLAVRQFRVWRVFSNKSMNPVPFTELKLFILTCILIIPDIILLICWTAFDTLEATVKDGNHLFCSSDYEILFYVLLLCYKALVSICGCALAILCRNFPGAYSDAKLIGFALYNESILGAILIPIIFVLQDEYFIQWILITLGLLFYYLSTFSIFMIPKIYGLLVVDKGRLSTDFNHLMPNNQNSNSESSRPKSQM